jgi:hypothetical protein
MKKIKEIADNMFNEAMSQPLVKHDYQIKNCISYWFPKLLKTGVPVPETVIIDTGTGIYDFYNLIDNQTPEIKEKLSNLINKIYNASLKVGTPFFLRTGILSGKHEWKDTCFVPDNKASTLKNHIMHLVNASAIAFPGQPVDVWAVRNMIETIPVFTAFWGRMPITKERRFFIENGKIKGHIPYWPKEAFEGEHTFKSSPKWEKAIERLSRMEEGEEFEAISIIEKLAPEFEGAWSVDLLASKNNGWIVTDMALAHMSYGYDLVFKK